MEMDMGLDLPKFLNSQDLDTGIWHIYIYIYLNQKQKIQFSKYILLQITLTNSETQTAILRFVYFRIRRGTIL
jgi:hypothetical protein